MLENRRKFYIKLVSGNIIKDAEIFSTMSPYCTLQYND